MNQDLKKKSQSKKEANASLNDKNFKLILQSDILVGVIVVSLLIMCALVGFYKLKLSKWNNFLMS